MPFVTHFDPHSVCSAAQGSYDGANVVQGGERDEWCFVDQGNGFYKIKNKKTNGLILDTVDMTHGASVIIKSGKLRMVAWTAIEN